MSVMWCLSGSLDARPVSDGRAADVAYDTAASAGLSLEIEGAGESASVYRKNSTLEDGSSSSSSSSGRRQEHQLANNAPPH